MLYSILAVIVAALGVVAYTRRRRLWQIWCCCVLLGRGHSRRVGPVTIRRSARRPQPHRAFDSRSPAPAAQGAGPFSAAASTLSAHGPCFAVSARAIEIVPGPPEFLAKLLSMIDTARDTVHIAALYLGCSKMCQSVADRIEAALQRQPALNVTLLLDYGRSLRRERDGSTVLSILSSVKTAFPSRFSVRMFMVPLCGAAFRHAPPAIREFAGVQHMKGCIVDDDVLMTGANLNDDYFTDRQDRYMVFYKAPALAAWTRSLISTLAELSFDAAVGASADDLPLVPKWPSEQPHPVWSGPSPRMTHEFADTACKRVEELLRAEGDPLGKEAEEADTFVWPLVQMAPLGLEHDASVLPLVIESLPSSDHTATICSAYPNFTPSLTRAFRDSPLHFNLVAPKEEASGFYGAGGAKEWVPRVYTSLLRRFISRTAGRVTLWGWRRKGWTFHGKGIWVLPEGGRRAALTVVGSSNFGRRSEDLDMEFGFAVLTRDQALIQALKAEEAYIRSHAPEQFGDRELQELAGGTARKVISGSLSSLAKPFL
eukprot:TRINITY_DN3604_c3_g3_i1.p1 TRINITY_DN3604_c3_g3~~TRINITY_DN3604_c3_g3_i1.p1  ORF type:complete len:541 (+),score=158.97 TRINITY_DN3604_c3_g3_i1:894-2516(+)